MDGGGSGINVGLVGYKFMGRPHSSAHTDVGWFFGVTPVRRAVCGRDEAAVAGFAGEFGWQSHETSWERMVERDDVDAEILVKERPLAEGGMGTATADDATYFVARFRDGALGSFLATRFATGRRSFLRLEIFGSEGAVAFNLERLNELQFYSTEDEGREQGFRTILVTESNHPNISTWWPPGHIIGGEHAFIHEVADFLSSIS